MLLFVSIKLIQHVGVSMREDNLAVGDSVELEFTRESDVLGTERQTVQAEVRDVMGNIVVFDNPFGHEEPLVVVDPDDDVWARNPETGNDGFYGRNAEISA